LAENKKKEESLRKRQRKILSKKRETERL